MYNKVVSEELLNEKINKIAEDINNDYYGESLDIICLVNSATFFCTKVLLKLKIEVRLHYFSFSNINNKGIEGQIKVLLDLNDSLFEKNVLIVEGIVVSGKTQKYLMKFFSLQYPKTINICAIGVKKQALSSNLPLKYYGFEFGNEIVVGFGIGEITERSKPFLYVKNKD